MPVRVSIVLTDFFAIELPGNNFGNGALSKMGRIASIEELPLAASVDANP